MLPPQGSCEVDFWQYQAWHEQARDHGRTVEYILESTPVLNDYLAFPDVAQVVRRTHRVVAHRSCQVREHVEYLVTSLPRRMVTHEHLAQLRRWHWTIENGSALSSRCQLWRDRSHVHTGSAPQVLAASRNAIVSARCGLDWPYLPNGFRSCQRHLQTTLH